MNYYVYVGAVLMAAGFGLIAGSNWQKDICLANKSNVVFLESERIAREGKTDKEWYNSHPEAMGEAHPVAKGQK